MSLEYLTKKLKKEDGVTLVELLAAIAILSIIVTAFLALFTQAGRTNNMTNEVNEATFIAQEEMERVTHLSQRKTSINDFEQFNGDGVSINSKNDGKFLVTTSITKDSDEVDSLYRVIVRITEEDKERAKMETRLPFID